MGVRSGRHFDHIRVDILAQLSEIVLAVFYYSTRVLRTVTLDLPSIRTCGCPCT